MDDPSNTTRRRLCSAIIRAAKKRIARTRGDFTQLRSQLPLTMVRAPDQVGRLKKRAWRRLDGESGGIPNWRSSALLPMAAEAHGPSRQKVVSKIEINAPVDKVWAAVGNFQDMSWHPAVAKTEGTGGNDVGATRKLTLQSGGVINEKLTKYDAEDARSPTRSPTST